LGIAVASAGPYANMVLLTDNHTKASSLNLQAGYSSRCPANSVKAPKAQNTNRTKEINEK